LGNAHHAIKLILETTDAPSKMDNKFVLSKMDNKKVESQRWSALPPQFSQVRLSLPGKDVGQ
jgi:hypothetical protein